MQCIDITEESTGKPHDVARKEIPMYVNEVGYNPALNQNVFCGEQDDRVVKYFFRLQQPMKSGSRIELLTNYRDGYESVRERKGYGWRNLHEGLPGDNLFSQRLERNFEDRRQVEMIIKLEKSLQSLSEYLSFIHNDIWNPIISKITTVLDSEGSKLPISIQQWIATRRIQWMSNSFRQRLEKEQATPTSNNLLQQILIHNMTELLDTMQLSAVGLDRLPAELFLDEERQSVNQSTCEEITEEHCFYLQDSLPMVFDSSVYCKIATRLIKRLSMVVASACPNKKHIDDCSALGIQGSVCKAFYDAARLSKEEVKDSIMAFSSSPCESDLNFSSGIRLKSYLSAPFTKAFERIKPSGGFFMDNSTIPKGFVAALLEKLAYFDCVTLGGIEPHWDYGKPSLEIGDSFVMVKFAGLNVKEEPINELRDLCSAPRSVPAALKTSASINETWYLLWQVFWPIHSFAKEFLVQSDYSVAELCSILGIHTSLADFAIKRGMQKVDNKSILECCRPINCPPPQPRKREKSLKPKMPTSDIPRAPPRLIYEGPVKNFLPGRSSEGWTQKIYQRASGASVGHCDSYWYTPQEQYKLRSYAEISRFFTALESCNNDEVMAWKARK